MTSEPSRYAVRAVLRVIDILELLRERPAGATLAELAEVAEMPKSSVFRYLVTLESRGYVERPASDGVFQLGAAFIATEAQHLNVLARRARPLLEGLRDRFEETVNLGVLDGTRVVYLEIVESRRSMRFVSQKGDRDYLHSTALGKAIATLLSEDEIRSILRTEGMPARTDRTITDPDRFLAAIEAARNEGYAIDDGENELAGRCVAVPVPVSVPKAAISLSAPAARLSDAAAKEVADVLTEVANSIAQEIM